jgi:hypothetical protein
MNLAIVSNSHNRRFFTNREEQEALRKLARDVNERAGICGPPELTAEELQAQMVREGVRPEENAASRELLRMRYGDDYDQDKEFSRANSE